jgi:uracil-DNA glycosylase
MTAVLAYRSPNVCNHYAQHDPGLDCRGAADMRADNLWAYLADRTGARIALIGEAPGYNGCRFTGIPFTCEAQLVAWGDPRYRPTSLRSNRREPSAIAVWQILFGGPISGRLRYPAEASASTDALASDVALWNAFPWHPHVPGRPMTNRRPTAVEIRAGSEALALFLQWLQPERVVAVGRVAERALTALGVAATYVRHPSHGGRPSFQLAMKRAFAIHSDVSAMPSFDDSNVDTAHSILTHNAKQPLE